MKIYIKFLIVNFLKSLFFVSSVLLSLIFILNILTELEFFKEIQVKSYYPSYVAVLNSPALLFEMFPFIFLLTTQVFFINLFNDNQIEIFKYSGLKNSRILSIISISTLAISIFLITIFYSFSSNLKSFYLELKSKYTLDGKYLAVITNNGLWIKDIVDGKTNIINASKIDQNFLHNVFITEFDENYDVVRNIKSSKIDIKDKTWTVYQSNIYQNGESFKNEKFEIKSNFDYQKIQSLFSNLSSLSLLELFNLRNNYKLLSYSTTEVDIQILKIITYPINLTLMTILAAIIMFNTKEFKNTTLKLAIGLFMSVVIYYINNFFMIMGNTEKLSIQVSVWTPLLMLVIINYLMIRKINEK